MQDLKNRKLASMSWINAGILFGLYLISFLFLYPVYESNDDVSFQMLLSGFYTGQPEHLLIFTNTALGILLSNFYKISQNINWYTWFMLAAQFLAFWSILRTVIKKDQYIFYLALALAFIVLPGWYTVLKLNFTTIATLLSIAAFLVMMQQENRREYCLAVVLYSLGFLIRWESVIMTHILLGPLMLIHLGFRKSIRQFWPIALIAGALFLFNQFSYQGEWKAFLKLHKAKALVDHPMSRSFPQLTEEQLHRAGWSKNDAELFQNFIFEDPSTMQVEKIQALRTQLPAEDFNPFRNWRVMLRRTIHWLDLLSPSAYLLLGIGLLMAWLVNRRYTLMLAALLVFTTALFAFLFIPRYRGIMSIELTALAGIFWICLQQNEQQRFILLRMAGIGAGIYLFGLLISQHLAEAPDLRRMANRQYAYLQQHPEQVHVVISPGVRFEGLHPLKSCWKNEPETMRIIWAANLGGSPYQQAALRRVNADNVFYLLSERDNARLITSTPAVAQWVQRYFQEHRRQNCTPTEKTSEAFFHVWKFSCRAMEAASTPVN